MLEVFGIYEKSILGVTSYHVRSSILRRENAIRNIYKQPRSQGAGR